MKLACGLAAAAVFAALTPTPTSAQLPLLGPKCLGADATIVGTDGDDTLTGTPDADVIVGLQGDDTIHGLGKGDALCGGDGDDVIVGGPGHDGIVVGRGADEGAGGPGFDLVIEFSSDSCSPCLPVDPRARDRSVDHLSGGPSWDALGGEGGDDVIDGGDGQDLALLLSRFTSVHVDLTLGRAVSSAGGVDTLREVENVLGSPNRDTIRGDDKPNAIFGFLGSDVVDGAAGADWIHSNFDGSLLSGGEDESADTLVVSWGVDSMVDLAAGIAMSREDPAFWSPDMVVRFENVRGDDADDIISGDLNANLIEGGFGNDEINGVGGNDYLFGDFRDESVLSWGGAAAGNDALDGGEGRDRLNGGPLIDECRNGEAYVSCERRPGGDEAPSTGRDAGAALPWWWSRLEIDYLHEYAVPDALLGSLLQK